MNQWCWSEAHAMVSLVDQGWASQRAVAEAFGYSTRTVRRHGRRFEEGGLPALHRTDGYPRGRPRLEASRRRVVQQLKGQGHSQREIARRLGTQSVTRFSGVTVQRFHDLLCNLPPRAS